MLLMALMGCDVYCMMPLTLLSCVLLQLLSLDASISGFDVLQGATRMLQKHWVKYLMLRGHLNQSSLELLISYGCSISTGGFSGPFLSSKQLRTADSSMFYVSCGT